MPVTSISQSSFTPDTDAAEQRLAAIEGISIMMSLAYRNKAIGELNEEPVGAAWDGIALIAADARQKLNGPE